jgi:hypothetical protein
LNLSIEIYSDIQLDEPTEKTDDGLIWAPIARSGMLATRPGPNGEKLDQPLVFIPGHSENQRKEIGLQDLADAFNDKAIEYVTIPLSHENKVLENTGYIKQVKISDSKKMPGEKVLLAGHEFTEPDVKEKVERGTIPSRSSGILYDYKNTTTGKVYPAALDHVCLTPKPWMGGMEPYGAAELGDRTIVPMLLSEASISAKPAEKIQPTKLAQEAATSHQQKREEIQSEFLADIVWGEKPSFRDIEKQVEEILDRMSGGEEDVYPRYYLLDVNDEKVLIKVNYGIGPDQDAWVVPYTLDKENILHLAPFSEWIDSTKKWVTDTIDPAKDKAELDRLGMSLSEEEKTQLAVLTAKARKDLPKTAFVYPSEEKYPIHDIEHGRNALDRVAQNGSPEEQSKVRSDVYKKFPELKKNKESSTKMAEPLKAASANRLGLSERDNYQPIGGPMTLLAMSEEKMELLGLSDEAKEFQRQQNKAIEDLNVKLAETQKKEKETRVANRIGELKNEGFDAYPGLLKEIEATMMSDDGDIALKLQLSEHGHTASVPETATELAERFIKAMPRKDNKVDLGEFANKLETPSVDRPNLETTDAQKDKKDRQQMTGEELLAEMEMADPTLKRDKEFLALSENGKGK